MNDNDKIKKWTVPSGGDMTPQRFKKIISNEEFKEAMLIGYGKDGELIRYTTGLSRKDALWILESTRNDILN